MIGSTATVVPVQHRPHSPEVRVAISDLVRDHLPTQLGNFKVDRISSDRAIITADVPSQVGLQVAREVYFDHAGL